MGLRFPGIFFSEAHDLWDLFGSGWRESGHLWRAHVRRGPGGAGLMRDWWIWWLIWGCLSLRTFSIKDHQSIFFILKKMEKDRILDCDAYSYIRLHSPNPTSSPASLEVPRQSHWCSIYHVVGPYAMTAMPWSPCRFNNGQADVCPEKRGILIQFRIYSSWDI